MDPAGHAGTFSALQPKETIARPNARNKQRSDTIIRAFSLEIVFTKRFNRVTAQEELLSIWSQNYGPS
jgi:hypothetical protein